MLQRQGDVKKYQSESQEAQAQQNLRKFSGNKNSPLAGIKSINPLSKVSQAVSQTIVDLTASIKNQLASTTQHSTDTVADIQSLLHKASAPDNQIPQLINQAPASSGLLKDAVENSMEKQSQNSGPLIKPNQTKIRVTAGKEKQSQAVVNYAVAEIKDKSSSEIGFNEKLDAALKVAKIFNNEKTQAQLNVEDIQQDPSKKQYGPSQYGQSQLNTQESKSPQQNNENVSTTIPEELKTAVQWMAEEEVENKLVDLLSRQAKLRGIDLS